MTVDFDAELGVQVVALVAVGRLRMFEIHHFGDQEGAASGAQRPVPLT